MSVRGKALRIGILCIALFVASSCAISGKNQDSGLKAGNSEPPVVADSTAGTFGDSLAQGSEVVAHQQLPEMSSLPVIETDSLLAGSKDQVGISVERGDGFSRVLINVDQVQPAYEISTLNNPSRLVLDVFAQKAALNKEVKLANDPFLKQIRIGGHSDKTRVVFDIQDGLSGDSVSHLVDAQNNLLSVTFYDGSKLAAGADQGQREVDTAGFEQAVLPEVNEAVAATEGEPTEVFASAELVQEEERGGQSEQSIALDSAEPTQPADERSRIVIEKLAFQKSSNEAGQILISMSAPAAYNLQRTAPSEFVLSIPAAVASDAATAPQVAIRTFPGLRSVRAINRPNEAIVRMFVDQGAEVQAMPRGNDILIEARVGTVAQAPDARAQFEAGAPPVEAMPNDVSDSTTRQNPTGIRAADGSKIYTGRLISLDLQETDIDNALRIIAEVSNLNIIASDDVSGKVTLRLIDVPWDQALDVILKTNGLDEVTEGNVIRIAPVEKLKQEREALREAKRAAENLEDLTVQYIRVSYARVTDLKEQVESVLSERGTVSVDERTNQLIIKDIKKGHERAFELLKKLDLRTPQVLLETQIVEGSRNLLRDLGFQWNFSYIRSPETGNATGLNFPNTVAIGGGQAAGGNIVSFPAAITSTAGSAVTAVLDSADGSRTLTAEISALENEGKVKVISRPQVATINNKEAEIKSVETVRIRLPDAGTSVATGSGASASGGGTAAFEEIDVGITLKVTPQASPDYYVLLDVNAISSTFGSRIVDGIPSTKERVALSSILVKSGQTFALGGVYRIEDKDNIDGVPFMKDLPFMGWLFRRSFINKTDEELIFFITPHIVEGSFDPSLM